MEEEYLEYCEYCEINNYSPVTFEKFSKKIKPELSPLVWRRRKDNFVADFLSEYPKRGMVPCRELYDEYVEWCGDRITPLTMGMFSREVVRMKGKSTPRKINGKSMKMYIL